MNQKCNLCGRKECLRYYALLINVRERTPRRIANLKNAEATVCAECAKTLSIFLSSWHGCYSMDLDDE